jgi:hypothetical protein
MGPEGSRRLRLSGFLDNRHMAAGRMKSTKNLKYPIKNQTRDLPACSALSPTVCVTAYPTDVRFMAKQKHEGVLLS